MAHEEYYERDLPPSSGVPLTASDKRDKDLLEYATKVNPYIRNTNTNEVHSGDVDGRMIEMFGLNKNIPIGVYAANDIRSSNYTARVNAMIALADARKKKFDFKARDFNDIINARMLKANLLTLGKNIKGENILDKIKTSYTENRSEVLEADLRRPRPQDTRRY